MSEKGSSDSDKETGKVWGERIAELFNRTWEMEILLFGFVLVLLWPIPEQLSLWEGKVMLRLGVFENRELQGTLIFLLTVFRYMVHIMIAGMILHLVLRGFWIAVVGLNSVYPEGADLERLRLNDRFSRHFSERVSQLGNFAEKLDDVCSGNFALTFLLAFSCWALLGSILLNILVIGWGIGPIVEWGFGPAAGRMTEMILILLFLLLLLLYAFDFLSNGLLKRIRAKWFAVPYYYWYRYQSLITLSFLYRPLYYTFITRRARAVLPALVGGLVLLGFSLGGIRTDMEPYHTGASVHYWKGLERDQLVKTPMIPEKEVKVARLKIFIPYHTLKRSEVDGKTYLVHNGLIRSNCPQAKPFEQYRIDFFEDPGLPGLPLNIPEDPEYELKEGMRQKVLNCMEEHYRFMIDSVRTPTSEFLYHVHQHHDTPGFLVFLPLDDYEKGMHRLILEFKGEEVSVPFGPIPFYYAPASSRPEKGRQGEQ